MVEYPVVVNPMAGTVEVDPVADAAPVKIEYVLVDAEAERTRCVFGAIPAAGLVPIGSVNERMSG